MDYPDQSSNGHGTVVTVGTILSHGFTAAHAEGKVLARATVQVLGRSTTATRRIEYQIRRHCKRKLSISVPKQRLTKFGLH